MCGRRLLTLALIGLTVPPLAAFAHPVFDPSEFSGMPFIDYSSSPQGVLPPDSVVTDQYSLWGVWHDGHSTTPPGPPGIGSYSGLPALEAGTDHHLPILTLEMTFPDGVTDVGAFYLMGISTNAITLSVFDHEELLVESVTVPPDQMTPGEYDFNEGFVGLMTDQPFTIARFQSDNTTFVIDDLHFTPEPATLLLLALGALILLKQSRTPTRRPSGVK